MQQSHSIACEGYHQPALRTGYEQVVAQRTGDLFAISAQSDGKVISKTDKGIIVEYSDGKRQGINLGRQFGKAEGAVYPHDIVSMLNEGDVFTAGDNIAYNTGFFEPDFLNPKQVIWRSFISVRTALYESNQTHEDSSAISKKLSKRLSTKTSKIRSFTVEFKQGIKNMLKVGTEIQPTDILFTIENEITNELGMFDEETLSTLQRLSNKTPRAKIKGVIDRIEVFYHGNKEDMSSTLRVLANASDRELAERCKATGKPVISGQVTQEYRVAGTPLSLDTAEIKIYLTSISAMSTGDKGVFANQMKSVCGEVMDYDMTTESGEEVDAVFGSRSIYNRIVNSPFIIGTTNTLLKLIATKAVETYRGK